MLLYNNEGAPGISNGGALDSNSFVPQHYYDDDDDSTSSKAKSRTCSRNEQQQALFDDCVMAKEPHPLLGCDANLADAIKRESRTLSVHATTLKRQSLILLGEDFAEFFKNCGVNSSKTNHENSDVKSVSSDTSPDYEQIVTSSHLLHSCDSSSICTSDTSSVSINFSASRTSGGGGSSYEKAGTFQAPSPNSDFNKMQSVDERVVEKRNTSATHGPLSLENANPTAKHGSKHIRHQNLLDEHMIDYLCKPAKIPTADGDHQTVTIDFKFWVSLCFVRFRFYLLYDVTGIILDSCISFALGFCHYIVYF